MAYYNTCPHCGSNLDPGERCECVREKERRRTELGEILAIGNGGQLYIRGIRSENVRSRI